MKISNYTLSLMLAGLSTSLTPVLRPYASQLSQPDIYTILFVMFVICFAIGKIWPDLFTKKPKFENGQLVEDDPNDVPYYIRHKKLMWVAYALVLFGIVKMSIAPDKKIESVDNNSISLAK